MPRRTPLRRPPLTVVLVGPARLALKNFPQLKDTLKDFDTQAGTASLDIGLGAVGLLLAFELAIPLILVGGAILGVGAGLLFLGVALDPPVAAFVLTPLESDEAVPVNVATASVDETAGIAAGPVQASVIDTTGSVSGKLTAAWSSTAVSSFQAESATMPGATVTDSSGHKIGTGAVVLSAASPVSVAISGNDQYTIDGTGNLTFYGHPGGTLSISADWQSVSVTAAGALVIQLTTRGLSLGGQALPPGTYTISGSSVTLAASGPSASATFAQSLSIQASGAAVEIGPGTGSLSAGGKAQSPENETSLDAYTGTLSVAATVNATDTVSLAGTATDVLQVSATQSTLTTDQNTPVTLQANVATSLAGSYSLTANAPAGWTVRIDSSGTVTLTPAPGLQSGTYPIELIVQSTTDPSLIAQTLVDVTITPTQPGVELSSRPTAPPSQMPRPRPLCNRPSRLSETISERSARPSPTWPHTASSSRSSPTARSAGPTSRQPTSSC